MCQKDRITTLVCPPKIVNANNKGTSADHMMDKLVFVPTFVFRITGMLPLNSRLYGA